MVKWMQDKNAYTKKVTIENYGNQHRGVHAAEDIQKDQTVLYVPLE